jgi:hypothetical protein
MTGTIIDIDLAAIRADTSAQPRASISTSKIDEYVERMIEGDAFPPLVVFYDGEVYWLADGFHRHAAAVRQGFYNFPCDVREGGLREAVLFSCGANAAHGLPRGNADKRRAVVKMLSDPQWSKWPQSDIAKHCAVSREFVNRVAAQLEPSCDRSQDETREVTRGGTTYTQNTANIGKRLQPDQTAAATTKTGSTSEKPKVDTSPSVNAPIMPTSPASEPTDSHVDPAEAANLATGMRTAISGIDPILGRIVEVGASGFWKAIRSNPVGTDLQRIFEGTSRRLRAIADAYNGSADTTPPTATADTKAQPIKATAERPVRLSSGTSAAATAARSKTSYEKLEGQLEMPLDRMKAEPEVSPPVPVTKTITTDDDSHLDVPGFLRRQGDAHGARDEQGS